MSEWISVEDRLPTPDQRFVVYDAHFERQKDINCIYMGRISKSWGIAMEGQNGPNPTITHWMEVEPPK